METNAGRVQRGVLSLGDDLGDLAVLLFLGGGLFRGRGP